jgi:hypothetical protein
MLALNAKETPQGIAGAVARAPGAARPSPSRNDDKFAYSVSYATLPIPDFSCGLDPLSPDYQEAL